MSKTVYLPRAREGEEPDVFVAVNGKAWRVRKGMEVEVPDAVAGVLANAQAADEAIEAFLRDADRTAEL